MAKMTAERLAAWALIPALLLLFAVAASEVHSFDVFWQLHLGRYILETFSVPDQDLFSLAWSVERWEHCWLHDVLIYLGYRLGGYEAISLIKGAIITGTASVLIWVARRRGGSWLAISAVLLPALYPTIGGWLERPQLWSFLFFALTLLAFEFGVLSRKEWLWLLPAIMLLWVNLHAGAILLFMLVGAAAAALAIRSVSGRANKREWGCFVLSLLGVLLATGLTPYGPKVLESLLPMIHVDSWSDQGIARYLANMDWRKSSFERMPEYYVVLVVSLVVVALGWRRMDLRALFVLFGVAIMGGTLMRHSPFFYFALIAYLPACLTDAAQRASSRLLWVVHFRWVALAGALLVSVHLYRPVLSTYGVFELGLRTWHYPIEAARFVERASIPGNLYNTYDWGGYLMWALYPEYRVFWDGRSTSEIMFREGLSIMKAEFGWQQKLKRHNVNQVVTKACLVDTGQRYPIVDALRKSDEWALVFADVSAMIFVRRSAVHDDWLAQVELPDERALQTVLSEAQLLVQYGPQRLMAWLEIALVEAQRRNYAEAYAALAQLLRRSPQTARWPSVAHLLSEIKSKAGKELMF